MLLEVKDLMRGWPQAKVGQKLKGTVRSIRRVFHGPLATADPM